MPLRLRELSSVFSFIFKASVFHRFFLGFIVGACCFVISARAQEGVTFTDKDSMYFGVGSGPFLPFGIVGVRDNYPMWGMWFSHPSEVSQIEYAFLAANAKGVTFYNFSVGLRIDFDVLGAVQSYFTLGIDANYYKRKSTVLRDFDFALVTGGHAGFGLLQKVTEGMFFRGDCKFSFGPGKSAYVGLGLMWEFGDGAQATP